MKGKKIVVIGGGKMGEVIMSGILSAGLGQPGSVTVTDIVPDRLAYLKGKYAVAASEDNRKAAREADIIVLAVKPQGMGDVLKELATVIDRKKLIISIAAGIPIRFIAEHLKKGVPIVRVMPNTPALVGEGRSGAGGGRECLRGRSGRGPGDLRCPGRDGRRQGRPHGRRDGALRAAVPPTHSS